MGKKRNLVRRRANGESLAALRIEVSIPETKRVLEAFTEDRLAALNALVRGVRESAASVVNQLLNAEMEKPKPKA